MLHERSVAVACSHSGVSEEFSLLVTSINVEEVLTIRCTMDDFQIFPRIESCRRSKKKEEDRGSD